jgi:hypothetical protein
MIRTACLLLAAFAAPLGADERVAPYVPTVEEDVELMLDVAGVGPTDYVIDLGSGDGRIVIAAARRGATAHGVELDAGLVELARRNAARAGVDDRAAFLEGDIFAADIGRASVVTLYLFPEANLALRPKLLAELAPGTRVVSNSFHMGDWPPDRHDLSARSSGGILLWVVPAVVGGDWNIEIEGDPLAYRLAVTQRHQEIRLELTSATSEPGRTRAWLVRDAALGGPRLAFRAEHAGRSFAFSGELVDGALTGFVQIDDSAGERIAGWRGRR